MSWWERRKTSIVPPDDTSKRQGDDHIWGTSTLVMHVRKKVRIWSALAVGFDGLVIDIESKKDVSRDVTLLSSESKS